MYKVMGQLKKYFSLDVEASGPVPGMYSMISLGMCVVGNPDQQFYVELRPLNRRFTLEAMKIGCLELECLSDLKARDPSYDARSKKFNPQKVLRHLEKVGESPAVAMTRLNNWIFLVTLPCKAVVAAAPASFDVAFQNYYFARFFHGQNPFGHSSEDINSMYRGLRRNVESHIEGMDFADGRRYPHHALDDAIHQAKHFQIVLQEMGYENP